jgi:hypothetical protein
MQKEGMTFFIPLNTLIFALLKIKNLINNLNEKHFCFHFCQFGFGMFKF